MTFIRQHTKAQLICFLFFISLSACGQQKSQLVDIRDESDSIYQYQTSPSSGGTGKFYMGREIAQVMGHLGAEWLERPEREREERTDLLLKALQLKPMDVVADIGAGSGYFTFRLSKLVPQGKVIAVDIQPEMIAFLEEKKKKLKASNVAPLLGDITNPNIPDNTLDLVLLVDAYHEFSHPRAMMYELVKALKPGGRVALVEYRAEDPEVPIKPLHKMTEAQAKLEMEAVGLKWLSTSAVLPQQHLLFFEKPKK